jgi:hypothetical protein
VPSQEGERADRVDGMRAVEELDFGAIRNAQARVEAADLGVLVGHPFVGRHAVLMAALHHEGARRHEARKVRIIHHVGEVEFQHVVFLRQHVAVARGRARRLPDPLVEIGGADGECVAIEQRGHAHRRLAAVRQAVEADARAIHEGQSAEPLQQALVLPEDEREKRQLQWMALALDQAEAVLADVWVLRRERDEALFGQPDGILVVVMRIDLGIHHLLRTALQAMLADHHGAPFARPDILGHEQNPVGENAGPDIQHHFVPAIFRLVEDQPRSRIGRYAGIGKSADHLVPNVLAHRLRGLMPCLRRRRVRLRPEGLASLFRAADQSLRMRDELIELAVKADRGIEIAAKIRGRAAHR